jgi:hypothetical protein
MSTVLGVEARGLENARWPVRYCGEQPMRIERIKRKHWMVVGLLVGLVLELVWRGPSGSSGRDLLASADVIGSQAFF